MKKILNKRLESLSAFINQNDVVLDIGCDHGLLEIYLFLNKNIKVIGSDINIKPLDKARENLAKYHLEDKIPLRLGDGLNTLSKDINTIVISGMGGQNIINILKDIKKHSHVKKIVISPNNDFPLTRKEIKKLGFYINRETIVFEKDKYYLISEYLLGKKRSSNFFGKLDLDDHTVKKYYKYVYDTNKSILKKLTIKNKLKKMSLIKENLRIKRIK